jgi:hypothetical protein
MGGSDGQVRPDGKGGVLLTLPARLTRCEAGMVLVAIGTCIGINHRPDQRPPVATYLKPIAN